VQQPAAPTPQAAPPGAEPAAPAGALGVTRRGTRQAKIYTSKPVPIDFAGPEHRYVRSDLEIYGIYHGGPSYEGRIFLNNSKADQTTARTRENGYAGSFYIFGHGGCLGDPGHCEVNEEKREEYDFRSPHPLTPAKKKVTVTNTLREIAKTNKTATITVVPVVTATNELCDDLDVFRFEKMRFVSYNP
jgi:tyrosinase